MERWETVSSVDDAHELLVASDRAAGGPDGFIPARDRSTTARLVELGAVHGLRREGRLVAAVTVEETPTFDPHEDCAAVARVLYMRRLCVAADVADPLLGYRAVRRVVRAARQEGYDAVRSEVNPDLTGVCEMLRSVGFRQRGPVRQGRVAPVAQMELLL
jgi:hypothetical protein